MNISQHLAVFVRDNLLCKTVFSLTGGGAMFLNDAFGNTPGLQCVYNHHEQACAMAALGHSKLTGLGVCVTTTGCGATNAMTGLLDAWQDSQPVLFISGQVKTKETTYGSGLPLRGFGVQELNIIPVVSSLVKKAFFIRSKEEYISFLAELPTILFCDRPGPVWVDIPMDVQSMPLHDADLGDIVTRCFTHNSSSTLDPTDQTLAKLKASLEKSTKPVILVGNGLRLSKNGESIQRLADYCERHNIPIVATYLAADFFSCTYPNYLGVVGLKAARRANIALHNADLVVSIGSRLATSVIGFEYEKFAPNADIYAIDIDLDEHKKRTLPSLNLIHSDATEFVDWLAEQCQHLDASQYHRWLSTCSRLKQLLPIQEQSSPKDSVSIYDVVDGICASAAQDDVVVSDAGSAYYVSSIMFQKTSRQRYLTSGAQADMGFSVPAAIGASFSLSNPISRIHAITGDGSFQLNIQELQTISTYSLPITIYVLNNNGYLSIRATQNTFFPGRQCGTDSTNGVHFPNLKLIAAAYGLRYIRINVRRELLQLLSDSHNSDQPCLCEVICPANEAIIPRTKTVKHSSGKLESCPLSDMLPDLSESTQLAIRELGLTL